jgi:hypothetical protein
MRRSLGLLKPTLLLLFGSACSGVPTDEGQGAGAVSSGGSSGSGASAGASGSGLTGAGASAGVSAGGAGGSGAGAGAGTGGSGAEPPVVPTTEACPTQEVPRTALRRLTRFEYANSVRDLLQVDVTAADDLPSDEITNGFDNNAAVLTVSSLHAEKYVLVSEALAKLAVQNLPALSDCDAAVTGEEACALAFAQSFGRRAFRRPLTTADEQALMAAYTAGRTDGSYAEGIEVMIRAALQSSNFVYRLETTTPTDPSARLVPLSPYELATRLSYLIWASAPDDALLDAAARGELTTKEQIAAQARAMLNSPKARAAVTNFFRQWTSTTRLEITSKIPALFPSFTDELRAAMSAELPAFVEHVIWSSDHTLSTLLTAPVAFVSGPLAELYGVTAPAGGGTAPVLVDLPPEQGRSGILTQAGFLSVQGHPDQTSPVLRGKFVRSMLLCQPPDPPPPDIDISVPSIDQEGTARERFSAHLTAGASCYGCHALMDPIGLAFENFDAIGQYRATDAGRPIDVSGEILEATDPSLSGAFTGVRELTAKLAQSDQVRDCVATQWFRFAAGRLESQGDSCSLATFQETLAASGGDLIELIVGMTQIDSFMYRSPVTP